MLWSVVKHIVVGLFDTEFLTLVVKMGSLLRGPKTRASLASLGLLQ